MPNIRADPNNRAGKIALLVYIIHRYYVVINEGVEFFVYYMNKLREEKDFFRKNMARLLLY